MVDWTTSRLNLHYHWKTVLLWGLIIGGALVLAFGPLCERANAWVKGNQTFPEGEVAVVLHRFCRSTFDVGCDVHPSQEKSQSIIQSVLIEWNEAGANWMFHTRSARPSDDPCNMSDAVPVILATKDNLCPGDRFPRSSTAGMVRAFSGRARVYVNANNLVSFGSRGFRRILLHEFGHVVGLGHPDEAGQNVVAIMNGTNDLTSLQPDDIAGIQALYGVRPGTTMPPPPEEEEQDDLEPVSGYLENPGDGSYQSGIGVISGWTCEAEEVVIEIGTLPPQVAAYGTERLDTAGVCGDTDNGFGLLFNWNLLGDGTHTVVALVDGLELGRAQVTVSTFGEEFVRGARGRYRLPDFPWVGRSTVIEWDQSLQNFVITEVE